MEAIGRRKALKNKGCEGMQGDARVEKGFTPALLNAVLPSPYHLRAGHYQRFATGSAEAAQD
jgi:hypothetical protein